MKNKKLLAIILLSLSFCFVSGAGYGEIPEWTHKERPISNLEFLLLEARVNIIMRNPEVFGEVLFYYDPFGGYGRYGMQLPLSEGVDTKDKICIKINDRLGLYSTLSGVALLGRFKKDLEAIYAYIDRIATDMNNDIAAKLKSKGDIPLAYFYQGEYHLWEN